MSNIAYVDIRRFGGTPQLRDHEESGIARNDVLFATPRAETAVYHDTYVARLVLNVLEKFSTAMRIMRQKQSESSDVSEIIICCEEKLL